MPGEPDDPNPPIDLNAEARALMRAAGGGVVSELRSTQSAPNLARMAAKTYHLLDLKLVERQTPGRACKIGCDHCCHRVIAATAPEVAGAVAYVVNRFSPSDRVGLLERMGAYLAEIGPAQGRELYRLRSACPFLENRRCTIYEARPISCRGHFATDVSACRAAQKDADLPFPETQTEAVFEGATSQGVLSALGSQGQFSNTLDFARAVWMFLEHPELSESQIFQFCVPAWECPPPPPQQPGHYPTYPPPRTEPGQEISLSHPKGEGRGQGSRSTPDLAADEPIGIVDASDLNEARHILFATGDTDAAFAAAPNSHPVHVLFRRLAPHVLRTNDDVEESRQRFEAAFRSFVEMDADPRQKFDAISEFSTLRLSYLQGDDRQILNEIGYFEASLARSLLPDLTEPISRRRRGRLRVGYIGDQLDGSSSGLWATGWLRHHGPDIETYAFDLSQGPRPRSNLFKDLVDHFFHLPGPVTETARFIKSQEVDVLIYPDLSSRGRPIQFGLLRLAPVQCAGWGGPGTTGLPTIDYFISGDDMEPSDGEDHYRERLVRLPGTGLCYPPLDPDLPRLTKAEFGLDDGPLMLCVQTAPKLLPKWDPVLREITDRTHRPIIFFRYPQWPYWLLEDRLKKAGVRAIFMPVYSPETFRALLGLADVAIDTIGWSGGITAIETIGAGLPTVTLPGQFRRSRHTSAFLRAAGAPGLIANDVEDYIDLATNPGRRQEAVGQWQPAVFDDRRPIEALNRFLLEL